MDKFDFSELLKLHEKRHRGKPTQLSSFAGGVKNRLQNNLKHRKSSRLTDFDNFRNIAGCVSPAPVSKAQQKMEHRRQQLEKWKQEKEKQKKEKATRKKPFVTGIPHNPQKFVPPPPLKPLGRVTRSQMAQTNNSGGKKQTFQSFAPANASFKPPQLKDKVPTLFFNKPQKKKNININFDPIIPGNQKDVRQTRSKTMSNLVGNKKLQSKQTEKETRGIVRKQNVKVPKLENHVFSSSSSISQSSLSCESDKNQSPILKRPSRKTIFEINSPASRNRTPKKSIQESTIFTPNNLLPKSESNTEERLRSPKSPVEVQKTPEQIVSEAKQFSPLVTMSRGKENARREMMKKIGEGLLVEDQEASNMDAVAQFRRQLASETERITGMCREWDNISNNNPLPEPVQEAILGAVGQARLLVSQKLVQFSQLVERCARPADHLVDPAALVTCADLHGFWDMVYMQVLDVDMRFKKLEEMRARNWTEEPLEIKKKVTKQVAKKVVKPAGGKSRIREMIAAARKAKKEEEEQTKSPAAKSPPAKNLAARSPPVKSTDISKTFEGGFFVVKTPVHSPSVGTPRNKSLLKAVLSSEAKKASASRNSASFAMLRASIFGKHVEYDGIEPLPQTPINLKATPSRSILKSANATTVKSGTKSIKTVLFDSYNIPPKSNISALGTDSGITSMDQDQENKENCTTKGKLQRQDAVDISPVMTRSRRKSMQTPDLSTLPSTSGVTDVEGKVRRGRKNPSLVSEKSLTESSETPKRSSRRRK